MATKTFKRIKAVILPSFPLEENKVYFLKFDSAIRIIKTMDPTTKQPKDAEVCQVTDLQEEKSGQLMIGTILAKELQEKYPKEGYVGKCFEVTKTKVEGKRYKNYELYEIQA